MICNCNKTNLTMSDFDVCPSYYPKYKAVKQFETADIEQNLLITIDELKACGCVSPACVLGDGSSNVFVDIVVEVWFYHISGTYAGRWVRFDTGTSLGAVVSIDPSGNIWLYTGGTQGSYRVVVLG